MSTTTESTDTSYLIKFGRIGRNHDVAPLVARVRDADHLADVIYRYARPFLWSQDVEVVVNLEPDKMLGLIMCGFQSGGSFTVAPAVLKPVELLRAAALAASVTTTRRPPSSTNATAACAPGGGDCWFEQQARAELAAAGRPTSGADQ